MLEMCLNPNCTNTVRALERYCSDECEVWTHTKELGPGVPWVVRYDPYAGATMYCTEMDGPDLDYEIAVFEGMEPDSEAERVVKAGLKALYGVDL